MMKKLNYKFVKNIPDSIEEEIIYISMDYATAIHKCCCGCGNEVVTPLSPTDWSLIFNGKDITLDPSIGNWSLECQSHYWIINSEVVWAPKWTKKQIELGRKGDLLSKKKFYKKGGPFFNLFRNKK